VVALTKQTKNSPIQLASADFAVSKFVHAQKSLIAFELKLQKNGAFGTTHRVCTVPASCS
jgi:hypothetical protein